MEMILGLTTCDKCGEPMKVGQEIVVIGLSTVARENCDFEAPDPEIRYACHLDCWDGGAFDQRRSESLDEGVRVWAPLTQ